MCITTTPPPLPSTSLRCRTERMRVGSYTRPRHFAAADGETLCGGEGWSVRGGPSGQ